MITQTFFTLLKKALSEHDFLKEIPLISSLSIKPIAKAALLFEVISETQSDGEFHLEVLSNYCGLKEKLEIAQAFEKLLLNLDLQDMGLEFERLRNTKGHIFSVYFKNFN